MAEPPTADAHDDTSPGSGEPVVPSGQAVNDTNMNSETSNDPLAAAMAEIDREVNEAMAEMDEAVRAEHSGEVATGDAVTPGSEITGTIAGVSAEDIFLEFGVKSQGVMSRAQWTDETAPVVGQRVEVVVDRFDEETSLLIVYRKGAIQRASWSNLSVGMIVEGRVTGLNKGGLEVDFQGIRGFMPGSQVDIIPLKDISILLNEKVQCIVKEVDRRSKNVVVSRRKYLERARAEARKILKAELEVGQLRRGTVRNITDFGAFVDLGGLEGLVHIRELSWGTVDKVTDVLSVGQEIEVKVLKIEENHKRISLSLRHAQPDPWISAADRFPEGMNLKVKIVRVADFGAFAELEAGIEGLIPISEMGWSRVQRTADVVQVGDLVDAVVLRVEPKKHRLALSMKQAQPDPWSGVLTDYAVQTVVSGRVTRLADFGAFLELTPGVEGLIHISELSDKHVKSAGDAVEIGQVVEARILSIDEEKRRISLSIKQVKDPETFDADASEEPPKPPKKRRKPLRGGLSSHFQW